MVLKVQVCLAIAVAVCCSSLAQSGYLAPAGFEPYVAQRRSQLIDVGQLATSRQLALPQFGQSQLLATSRYETRARDMKQPQELQQQQQQLKTDDQQSGSRQQVDSSKQPETQHQQHQLGAPANQPGGDKRKHQKHDESSSGGYFSSIARKGFGLGLGIFG